MSSSTKRFIRAPNLGGPILVDTKSDDLHWCANPDGLDYVPDSQRTKALCGRPLTYETDAGSNPNNVSCMDCVRLLNKDES